MYRVLHTNENFTLQIVPVGPKKRLLFTLFLALLHPFTIFRF
jgi:hypothetical protein